MSDSGAQYATPATAVITTKSGTNSLHGTLFETARNNAIGVAKSRSDLPSYTAPPTTSAMNLASVPAGRLFCPMCTTEKISPSGFSPTSDSLYAQASDSGFTVPTMAMRQGDFSEAYNSAGVLQTIYDPSTTTNSPNCASTGGANPYCRTAFLGNKITTAESPAAKVFYAMIPQPTSQANPLVANNLTASVGSYEVIPQVTFRLDHVFNENNRAYLRFSDVDSAVNTSGWQSLAADGIPAGAALGYQNAPSLSFFTAVGYTHIFSPTFFAETIAGQQWFNHKQLIGTGSNTDLEAMLGLPNNFGEPGFPSTSGLIRNLHQQSNRHLDVADHLESRRELHQDCGAASVAFWWPLPARTHGRFASGTGGQYRVHG